MRAREKAVMLTDTTMPVSTRPLGMGLINRLASGVTPSPITGATRPSM